MWATLALLTALNGTPAQTGGLELKNVRPTYGMLGQERKDTEFLPGDMFILTFDIEGLQVTKEGLAQYSIGMELTGKNPKTGKVEKMFGKDPQEQQTVTTLGGSRVPSFARALIGIDTPPGDYTMKVVVTDRAAQKSQTLEKPFTVKKLEFGIVRVGFTYLDLEEGQPAGRPQYAPPVGVPGQNLLLSFTAVGFELKGDKQQPNVSVSMEILDEGGTSIHKFSGTAKDIDEPFKKLGVIPFQFPIHLNRTGKFKVVLRATDEFTKKSAEQALELKVVEIK
jgi:hypothetical protein